MKTSRILAFASLLILLTTLTVCAQQDETAIDQIKERISKLEAIDRDKNTPDDIRILNRGFLKEQRAQLHTLLKNKLDGLVKYQSEVRSALTADQNSVLEKSIRNLEADLRNLESEPPTSVLESAGNGDTRGNPSRAAGEGETRADSQPAGAGGQPEPAAAVIGGNVGKCPAKLIDTVRLIKTTRGNSMRVRLLVPLSKIPPYLVGNALSIPTGQVVIVTKPSNTIYTKAGLAFASAPSPPGPKYLTITLNDTPALPPDDNEASIMLNNLPFDCNGPTVVPSTTATGKIYGKNNLGELADEAKKALDDAAAHAKTTDEKNIFAGFAAAKGQGGKTAGDADISFNKTLWGSRVGAGGLFDKVVVSFLAKKSSGDKADPRHFTTGITFRKTMLLQGRKLFNEQQKFIQTQLTQQPQSVGSKLETLETNNETLSRRGFFRALLIDETLNLEGEAFDFKTVNFVSDTQFKVASISKKLFGTNGFWNLRLVAGPELGRNLNKPGQPGSGIPATPALNSVNWITRFKAGAQLALRYLPADNSGTNWGLELDLAFVNRHLFSNEVFTDVTNTGSSSPTKTITVGKGNKSWRQADFKIFPFGDEKARYGFKLSYTHGQLPPAFTFTKSFQYGFVIETKDDKSSGKPANQ